MRLRAVSVEKMVWTMSSNEDFVQGKAAMIDGKEKLLQKENSGSTCRIQKDEVRSGRVCGEKGGCQ